MKNGSPAIREARRLVLEKYNMFAQTAAVIHNHRETGTIRPGAMLKGRHVLRKKSAQCPSGIGRHPGL